ncbi:ABC transporter ATP-binding protein [Motilibacter peucedani]|uniref:ABC transporter ATP-binding protein n=1 Tax=Motilibacter peucedani TaxID=598650 RepID=UPI001E63875F|nr:ABC transporter ATP-binding protein [Motilibacter peucedani]
MPAVDVRGLTRRFGGTLALDGVDLHVAPGTVHGLLGPNGAGKTTLLRILVGLVHSDSGSVRVLGQDPAAGPRAREGVAALIEAPRFRPALSAEDNLRMLADLDGGRAAAVLDEALATTGLTAERRRPVRHFSLGMRQRLGMAAALVREPQLLVLDEPANGLDPAGSRDMLDLVGRLAAEGRTVLLASHDMADVAAACDDVTILVRGQVARSGPVAALRAEAPAPAHLLETADDARAAEVAASLGLPVSRTRGDTRDDALLVSAAQGSMDALVAALAAAGVPVRTLRVQTEPLQALFFELTEPERAREPAS